MSRVGFIKLCQNGGLTVAMWLLFMQASVAQSPPQFTSSPVTTGYYNIAYSYSITTSDSESDAVEIILSNGTLPDGLSLFDNGDGTASISGVPVTPGSFAVELTVRQLDDGTQNDVQPFTIKIKDEATVNLVGLSQTYTGSSRVVTATTIPAGLSVAITYNGSLTPPTNAGTYAIVANVSDPDYYGSSSGSLVVAKAPLSITADNLSKVYAQPNPTLTMQFSGFVGSDNTSSISLPTLNTTALLSSPAGTYTIGLTGGSATNYTLTLTGATLTINKAPLTIDANNQSKAYGAALPTLTASYTGLVNGDNASAVTGLSISTTATASSGAGTYPITLSGASAANYNLTTNNGTLTVTKVPLTITAVDQSKVYGAGLPVFTVTYATFVNGDNASAVTGLVISTPATSASAIGTYPITLSGASAANYTLTMDPGNLTVTPAPLTARADDLSKTYGAANPTLTITYTGFVNGDNTSSITVPTASTAATAGSGAGTYGITLSGGSASNYTLALQSGTLTINKAPLTAKADDLSKIYGSANPTLTISYTGFVNGDLPTSITIPSISTTATTTSAVGSYPITLVGGNATNYTLALVAGTLSVTKASLTAEADDQTRIFGQPNPTLTISYTGFVNGDNASSITAPSISTGATPATNAGSYPITLSGGSAANYNLVLQNGTITITKATPVVTWGNPTAINYGTPLGAAQLDATATVAGTFVYTPAAGTILPASAGHTLSVNFSPTDATNYNPVNGTTVVITVNKAIPVITWANPSPITYGTALSATQLNASSTAAGTFSYAPGLGTVLNAGANQALSVNFTPTDGANYLPVNGTQVNITVNKANPVITWAAPAAITYGTPLSATQLNATADVAGVFSYLPAAGTILGAGASQTLIVNFTPTATNNYNTVNNTQVLITVNRATPVISWLNPAAITYGTVLSTTQLNASTTVAGTFMYTPSIGTLLNAGVNQTLSVNFTPTDGANYNPVVGLTRTLTVNKADPVVTWPVPAAIIYGTPLSATQLNASANVPGVFTYTPPSGTIMNTGVGQTLSVDFSPTDASNYNTITGTTVPITVNKATPVITWAAPLPIKVGVALSSTQLNATANVPGTFVYTPPSGTVLPTGTNQTLSANFTPTDATNYNAVNNTTVLITVSAKDNPVISWTAPAAITYGTALSATQLNATADVPGTFTYTPPAGTILGAGANQTLSLDFVPTDAVNYNSIHSTNQITVNKATLNATAASTSRLYGAANPTFVINYSGFVNSETISVIDTAPTASSAAVAGSSAGTTFPIVPSGGVDNNYSFNYVNGTLTITKAPLTAKADDKSRSYGLVNPAFTITYSGFVNGDTKTSIVEPSIGTTAVPSSTVGSYGITLTGGSAVNYNITLQNGLLTINIAPLTIKADDKSKIYAQVNPALTISYSGFLNGDTPASITPPTISTTAVTGSDAGTYPITLTGGSAVNYGLIIQNGTLTIAKAALTAKADDKAKIFGQPNPALTITYTGFVNGDNASDITIPTVATAAGTGSNAGTYPITLSGGSAINYDLTLQNGTLTISRATPVVTWSSPAPITYGTALSSTELSATATVPGTFVYTPAAGTFLNAGANQTLSANFIPTDGTNYNVVNGTTVLITVNKATPVITWLTPAAITYGTPLGAGQLNATTTVAGTFAYTPPAGTILNAGANQSLSVNFTPSDGANYNAVNGTTVLITVNKATPVITWANPAAITFGTAIGAAQLNATSTVAGTFTYNPVSGTILNAGPNQVLSVNFVPTNGANYNPVNGTTVLLTVNKATPVITWANPAPITYGTALSATQLNASVGITGTFSYSPNVGTILNAGPNQPLTVNFTPTDMANYNVVNGTQVLITVNKALPVISWATPANISYGTALSATQLNATASVPGTFTYTPPVGTVLNTGTNQILSVNFSPTDAVNYSVVNGTTRLITVIKTTPVVTWPPPLPIKVGIPLGPTQLNATATVPGTFVYTPPSGTVLSAGPNQTLSVNFTPTDAANYNTVNNTQVQITVNLKDNPIITWANPGDITYGAALGGAQLNASANVPGTFIYSPAAGTVLNAGASQTLSATFTPTDNVNYNSIPTTVHINVNKATLTATASSPSRSYGASNPVFTVTYTGFVNGDSQSVIDVLASATSSAIVSSPAGSSFPVIPTGASDNNYNFNYVNGTLVINKANLTAKADDKSRSYGLANPVFTVSYSGFVNGDDPSDITAPTGTTTATLASNVGTYPINVSGGISANYTFIFQPGVLTVNIAPLTAKADNKAKTYGQANPGLTITYTGFLNNDSPSSITEPAISTTTTVLSPVGTYPITLSGGVAQNYGLILQGGTLTVGKANLTAKADDKTKIYGQANPANSITYTGFVNGDNAASITAPTVSGPAATAASSVGTYPITLTDGTATNYNLNLQNGALTITKAPLRINVQDKSRLYSQPNPPLTFTYVNADFVNGDSPATITQPAATTTATTASLPGSYPITVTGTTLNYNFVVTNGTLTVGKALLTVKADDKTKIYGDPNPPLTISYSGFVNGETLADVSTLPSVASAVTQTSDANSYPITVSGGASANYDFAYVPGTFLVNKATLTAAGGNQDRLFQTPNPLLTILYTGFVNGDTPAVLDVPPVATTTATTNSPVGPYPITVSGGSDNNYNFVYISGNLSVVSSFPPTINDFEILANEDEKLTFNYDDFNQNFTGYPGDLIRSIAIITLPANGTLTWNGNTLAAGDVVSVILGSLGDFSYHPAGDFNGNDPFTWNVFDGTFNATSNAVITIKVQPVNDAPVLTSIEADPIPYELGDPAVAVSKAVLVSDVDNGTIEGATITITENYKDGDFLSLEGASGPITATFDAEAGQLELKGQDSKSNYETALHNVYFRSPISSDTELSVKKVVIRVNDGTVDSNPASRTIEITKVFPDIGIVDAFTPNNDLIDDRWDFQNLQFYTTVKISVFDQNGTRVWDCEGRDCQWDGKIKGKDLPPGPYFYSMDLDSGKRTYHGTVTILR